MPDGVSVSNFAVCSSGQNCHSESRKLVSEVPLSVGETDLTIHRRRRQQWEPRVVASVYRNVLFGSFQQWKSGEKC